MSLNIWNQLDEVALYQSLDRMVGETDEDLFARMKKFAKWRCKTDYNTQVHTIPIQSGLLTYPILDITCDHPFEMKIDWEYFYIQNFPENPEDKEYARVFINMDSSPINKITEVLNSLPSFNYRVLDPYYTGIHHRFIARACTVTVETDFVSAKNMNLSHKHLLKGTLRADSGLYCKTEKESIQDLKVPGDYFLDCEAGYLQTYSNVEDGFFVTYRRYMPKASIEATELNLIPVSTLVKYGLTDDVIELVPYLLNGKVWGK